MSSPSLLEADRQALARFARISLARRDLAAFCALMDPKYESAAHTDLLCRHLEALERREIDRLIVMMPPRHSKTYHLSERFTAWTLGRRPSEPIILASYGAELAEQNSRRARALVQDERFPFPGVKVALDSAAVNRWSTTQGGTVIACGVLGAVTGFGAAGLIVDDAVKDRAAANSETERESAWSWFTEVARTRLMPRGVVAIGGTRWHDDDLIGRVLNSEEAARWTVLRLPALAEENDKLRRGVDDALWPAWYPRSFLDEQRTVMGSRAFAALYQQRPVPIEGALFKADWFEHRWRELPTGCFDDPKRAVKSVLAIDTASKTGLANDYSVLLFAITDEQSVFIVDVERRRMEFAELARTVVSMAERWRPDRVCIEDSSAGTALIQELRRLTALPIIGCPPRGSKISRVEATTASWESGRVKLPVNAPWLEVFIEEHLGFPAAKHDDTVDSAALAVSELLSREQNWCLSGLI